MVTTASTVSSEHNAAQVLRAAAREARAPTGSLSEVLKPYWGWIALLVALTLLANGLNLVIPQIIATTIDSYAAGDFDLARLWSRFGAATIGIFVFSYCLSIVQTYTSEVVARDLRTRVVAKLSGQDNAYVQDVSVAKLLTNLTSDIDSIKMFVAQAIVALLSSGFVILGATVLMVSIDWRLALAVLLVLPLIGGAFFLVLRQAKPLFGRFREAMDRLNTVINESIIGSSLIRLLNSQQSEYQKFSVANATERDVGLALVRLLASFAPVVAFAANVATLMIVALGGYFVINERMTLGEFTAFNTYVAILIFPITLVGSANSIIAQASASYRRITDVLSAPAAAPGTLKTQLRGEVTVSHLSLRFGQRQVLHDVSVHVPAGTRTAILGPTAAGKTQLLYALTGLIKAQSGDILIDGEPIERYEKEALHRQIGFVFQDGVLFNLTMRENIAFSHVIDEARMTRAIETAELKNFIDALPVGLDTPVSERGTSLSGGQKQRVMLARALALSPAILLLDDFTSRVDARTEREILARVAKGYPNITLISVTQNIASVQAYDQIVLLMEGRVLARGTHDELIHGSPEYVQIYNSQQSTEAYELRP